MTISQLNVELTQNNVVGVGGDRDDMTDRGSWRWSRLDRDRE